MSRESVRPEVQGAEALEFASLTAKTVVDLVNSIEVVKDHLHVQRASGMASRVVGALTGVTARRQVEVDTHLAISIDGMRSWLVEVTTQNAFSLRTLQFLNDRVANVSSDLEKLARFGAEQRGRLNRLAAEMQQVTDKIQAEVQLLRDEVRAREQRDRVFSAWGAGRFKMLPPLARLYVVMEELRWGAFGDHFSSARGAERTGMLRHAIDLAAVQLAKDMAGEPSTRFGIHHWIDSRKEDASAALGVLSYLGDSYQDDIAPLAFCVTQLPERLPLTVPRISSAGRLADMLANEVFASMREAA